MIHLRVRTEYSFKQTYAPIDRCVKRLKEIGCTHAGIVDRESTWGHVLWHEECRKAGIIPILGVELIVSEEEDIVTSMWFLAKNLAGLKELYRYSSKSYRQKVKTKFGSSPRLFQSDIIEMSQTGNVYIFAGEILDESFLIRCGAILDLSPASRIMNMSKEAMSKRIGGKLVETCDNFYAYQEDKDTFELTNGRTKPSPQYITEIKQDVGDLEFEDYNLPKAPMLHREGDLEKICREGIEYRRVHQFLEWDERYEARLRREIDLIRAKNFDSYFLVVSDMVIEAKRHMLVGPSRGSSAGSLVCYLTRITEIDPIKADLIFERFIDESRKDLPDIDIDFPGEKRHLVFEYMKKVYNHVANIGTVARFQPKSALIQVCEKLGIPPVATAGVKAAMIVRSSGDARHNNCLEDSLKETDPGQKLLKIYPDIIRACVLEGHAQHTGRHAAGLLVCNEEVENYCTVMDDGTAQVEKKTIESLNLLKVDVLGLRTLDILEESGINPDWYSLPLNDPKTFEIFNSRALCGIFQFEGQSMRNLSSQLHFDNVDLIDAVTALARPGPFGGGVTAEWLERRKGKEYRPFHPLVEKHMLKTNGLPIYQEQTMAIVREIGQFNWDKVSSIRKIVSLKKGKEFFNKFFPDFERGAIAQGMTSEEALRIWEYINSMGAYQMNKAHTYSYAVIAYWTAWLKAHHPLEFALANMRHGKDEETQLTMLQEMVREGLKYEPFNLNLSQETWSIKEGKLVAGFDSLKGFGPVKSKKFKEKRDKNELTESEIEQIKKAPSVFYDLFPMHHRYRRFYEDYKSENLLDPPVNIDQITDDNCGGKSLLFLGRLIDKNLRDYNEDVNVKKRNGKKGYGPVMFIDFRVADDTGRIQCRIDRYKYESMGHQIFEAKLGTVLLIRANFNIDRKTKKGIRFGFTQKVRIIEQVIDEGITILPPVPERKYDGPQIKLFDDPDE